MNDWVNTNRKEIIDLLKLYKEYIEEMEKHRKKVFDILNQYESEENFRKKIEKIDGDAYELIKQYVNMRNDLKFDFKKVFQTDNINKMEYLIKLLDQYHTK